MIVQNNATPPVVSSFSVNTGGSQAYQDQRSRLTKITLSFASPVTPSQFAAAPMRRGESHSPARPSRSGCLVHGHAGANRRHGGERPDHPDAADVVHG